MKYSASRNKDQGFTLIELLVVIAIIGILASVVLVSLNEARLRARDGARKSETQELVKALELYFSDDGVYPTYGGSTDTGGNLDGIEAGFYGVGAYLPRLPDEAATRYYYCVSLDRKSALLGVDTEDDESGTNYCIATRGPGPSYGCPAMEVMDSCIERFNN